MVQGWGAWEEREEKGIAQHQAGVWWTATSAHLDDKYKKYLGTPSCRGVKNVRVELPLSIPSRSGVTPE